VTVTATATATATATETETETATATATATTTATATATDEDHTTYCATFPEEAFELALFAEAERMGLLLEAVDDAALRRELRILAHEARERGRVEILDAS
jgi:hypothetical protein